MLKPYQEISIIDCGEPLVAIPTTFVFTDPHPYISLKAPYGNLSPFYLRSGVLQCLLKAQVYLQQIRPFWQIKIFDAYRPIAVQQFMVNYAFATLARSRGWNQADLSPQQTQELMESVLQFWALPSSNPKTPPPHSTGAAVDLTLVNQDGVEVNMGSAIDEISERSFPDFFQSSAIAVEKQFHQNRQILRQVMTQVGFQQHPNEWWHFSRGDQMWAWLVNQQLELGQQPVSACYGRWNECTPISSDR